MSTKQRDDIVMMKACLDTLLDDFRVAMETEALDEWAAAVRATAEYMAKRHGLVHCDDE